MTTKAKKRTPTTSFDEYKAIKDEIIEISEQRFENILTKRLLEFKKSLISELSTEFKSIDNRFESIEKRITFLTWFLPVFITLLMII